MSPASTTLLSLNYSKMQLCPALCATTNFLRFGVRCEIFSGNDFSLRPDASEKAYYGALCFVYRISVGRYERMLLPSETRVALLRKLSIPENLNLLYQLYYMLRNFGHWRAEFILEVFVTCQSSVKHLAHRWLAFAMLRHSKGVQNMANKTMTPR